MKMITDTLNIEFGTHHLLKQIPPKNIFFKAYCIKMLGANIWTHSIKLEQFMTSPDSLLVLENMAVYCNLMLISKWLTCHHTFFVTHYTQTLPHIEHEAEIRAGGKGPFLITRSVLLMCRCMKLPLCVFLFTQALALLSLCPASIMKEL